MKDILDYNNPTRGTEDTLRSRVLSSVSSWVENKVLESPGCVERFVCESFKTGETLDGPSYFLMAVSKYFLSHIKFIFHSTILAALL